MRRYVTNIKSTVSYISIIDLISKVMPGAKRDRTLYFRPYWTSPDLVILAGRQPHAEFGFFRGFRQKTLIQISARPSLQSPWAVSKTSAQLSKKYTYYLFVHKTVTWHWNKSWSYKWEFLTKDKLQEILFTYITYICSFCSFCFQFFVVTTDLCFLIKKTNCLQWHEKMDVHWNSE